MLYTIFAILMKWATFLEPHFFTAMDFSVFNEITCISLFK